MAKFTRLSTERREDLVAYLDGELDQATHEMIEASLAQNQVARHDLNQLSRAYDLLNFLPTATPQADLTQRTMSRIEVRSSQVWEAGKIWSPGIRRFFLGMIWCAILCAVAAGSYQASRNFIPAPADLLLQDLPVILKADRYSVIESTTFLRALHDQGVFEENQGGTP